MVDWDTRYMSLARFVGSWSKDKSRRIGAVIIGPEHTIRSIGYNGFVRGAADDVEARHNRPDKYAWTEHAERNAIYHAARFGVALDGCQMYVPWFPCVECARAIVQSGIKKLTAIRPEIDDPKWGDEFRMAEEILSEAQIIIQLLEE